MVDMALSLATGSSGSGAAGAAGFNSAWNPWVAPNAPSAYNDEFNGPAVVGWNVWDVPGYLSTSIVNGALRLTATRPSGTGRAMVGLYKQIPDTEYAVYTSAQFHGVMSTSINGGVAICQDLSTVPTTADFRTCERGFSSGEYTVSRTWSAYNGSLSLSSATLGWGAGRFLRHRVNGTLVNTDVSGDGKRWCMLANQTLTAPLSVALCIDLEQTGSISIDFDFFRVFTGAGSSGFDATSIGAPM